MGLPPEWSASKPLAMPSFLSWQRGLGSFLEEVLVRAIEQEREDQAVFDWAMNGHESSSLG